jgi:hypothetical protein
MLSKKRPDHAVAESRGDVKKMVKINKPHVHHHHLTEEEYKLRIPIMNKLIEESEGLVT